MDRVMRCINVKNIEQHFIRRHCRNEAEDADQ